MVEVIWKQYNSWSGCKIQGTNKYTLTDKQKDLHMWRALWLTAQVEGGGYFGTINSYDGAGISAGLEHKIAVYPRSMKQGSLWKLLRDIEFYSSYEAYGDINNFWAFLRENNKFIAQDGSLRDWNTGRLITGTEIRNLFAPPNGKVPATGPNWEKAKRAAILTHNLFSNKGTQQVQINSAIQSLVEGNGRDEQAAYKKTVGLEHPTTLVLDKNISKEFDLAWVVYHSFSVNAPSIARRVLINSNPEPSVEWCRRIVKMLGTNPYGNWDKRYERTRLDAIRSEIWDKRLFYNNGIMPRI